MAQAHITWTPSPSNSDDQLVQYRLAGDNAWTTFSTVAANINQETVTGLVANQIYEFRVLNNCAGGGTASSPLSTQVLLECPVVTLTPNSGSIDYSFPHLGGDINKYMVELLTVSNQVVGAAKVHQTPFGATIQGSFQGLSSATNYQVRVTVFAGDKLNHSKTCANIPTATLAAQVCNPPTGLNVVMT